MKDLLYRRNVAIILRRNDGCVLVCERADFPGSWQFPQGGIDKGETVAEALEREVREEVSLTPDYYNVVEHRGPYRYTFPKGVKKHGCDGQEQVYFLADLIKPCEGVLKPDKKEFRTCQWIRPEDFHLAWAGEMKRDVYVEVFRDFFGIALD